MNEKLLVPDIGEFENVEVIELLVKPGDQVNINDPVITIESDKSSIEIPATISGKVDSVKVKVGDKVSKGDLILTTLSSDNFVKEITPKNTENIIKQAENVISIDIKEITTLTDSFIICSADTDVQVKAISDNIRKNTSYKC